MTWPEFDPRYGMTHGPTQLPVTDSYFTGSEDARISMNFLKPSGYFTYHQVYHSEILRVTHVVF
jgi:hypothetical protein